MNERRQIALGLVGFGEVGSALGRGLRAAGLARVFAYDTGAAVGPFSGLIQRRAQEASVTLVDSCAALAERAELILGITPGSESVSVADALRPHLGPWHVYVDLAATTPKVKQRMAEMLRPRGARLADGAIMTSPLQDGHRVLILASGPAAREFGEVMTPWGMRIETVGQDLGTASGIKSVRTVFMKGMEALLVECLLAGERYGIRDVVLGSIAHWMDQRSFMESARFLVVTDAIHAARRAAEAQMSAEALLEIGVDPIMTQATTARLRWVADLGLKERFGGLVPDTIPEVLEAIEGRLRGESAAGGV